MPYKVPMSQKCSERIALVIFWGQNWDCAKFVFLDPVPPEIVADFPSGGSLFKICSQKIPNGLQVSFRMSCVRKGLKRVRGGVK